MWQGQNLCDYSMECIYMCTCAKAPDLGFPNFFYKLNSAPSSKGTLVIKKSLTSTLKKCAANIEVTRII